MNVKPSKQPEQPKAAPAPAAPPAPALPESFQDLSLLSQPLQPSKSDPPAPQPQARPQQPQPTGAAPSLFAVLPSQPIDMQPQMTDAFQFQPQQNFAQTPQNIARARATAPSYNTGQGSLKPTRLHVRYLRLAQSTEQLRSTTAAATNDGYSSPAYQVRFHIAARPKPRRDQSDETAAVVYATARYATADGGLPNAAGYRRKSVPTPTNGL